MEENQVVVEEKQTSLRARIVNILQYEEFLSEETIKNVLSSYKSIEKYAWIKHDKDIDLETKELKKPHFHIVLQFKTPIYTKHIAKWFGLEENFVDVPRGQNAFIQCVKYLTHESKKEQENGKHLYEDVEVISNFDFRNELEEFEAKIFKKEINGRGRKENIRKKVILEGLKLCQIDHDDYASDFVMLQKCRLEYLKSFAELPISRINFYITGGSGTGKSLSSRALAKTLIDPDNQLKDEEVFFVVGQQSAKFDGYDGQPVLIWDDLRAFDLLNHYGKNVGAIFNLFDIVPSSSQQNIKFSSVKLINSINIVNSVESFQKFADTICYKNGELDEPDKQIYRRFPFFVEIHNSQKYDFFVNKQFFNDDEPNYKAYLQHKNMGIGMMKITNAFKNDDSKKLELTKKHFEIVEKEHKKAVSKFEISENVEDLQRELELEILEMENKSCEVVEHIMQDMPTAKNEPELAYKWGGIENKAGKTPFK
jgi:ABC-type dipeptide/oligopeptide/nickel transport system, ATPase component